MREALENMSDVRATGLRLAFGQGLLIGIDRAKKDVSDRLSAERKSAGLSSEALQRHGTMTLSIAGILANPSKIRSEVLSATHAELISSAPTPTDQVKSYPHIFSVSARGARAVAIPIIGSEATSRMGELNPLQMMGRSEKRGLVTAKSTGESKVNALSSGFLPTYHAEWASYKNVAGEVKDRLQISRPSSTIDLRAIQMRGTIPRDQRRGQTVSQAEPGVTLTNSKPASSPSGQGTPSMPGVSHTREPGSIVAPLFVDRPGKRGANTYGETSSDTGSGDVGVSDANRVTSPIRGSNFKGNAKQSDASPKGYARRVWRWKRTGPKSST